MGDKPSSLAKSEQPEPELNFGPPARLPSPEPPLNFGLPARPRASSFPEERLSDIEALKQARQGSKSSFDEGVREGGERNSILTSENDDVGMDDAVRAGSKESVTPSCIEDSDVSDESFEFADEVRQTSASSDDEVSTADPDLPDQFPKLRISCHEEEDSFADDDFGEPQVQRAGKRFRAESRSRSFTRQVTAPGRLQVADWTVHGEMTVLYDGRGSLANSTVRRASACSSTASPLQAMMMTDVAVKSVSTSCFDVGSLEMIRRECSILQRLGDGHPHILPLLGFEELESELVLLTRLAPDGDLARLVPSGRCLEEAEVRRLDRQLLSALAHLQEQRIVHGDVKPQNVLLTQVEGAYVAQLADFGLAAEVPAGQGFVTVQNVQGSYGFIPAEVKRCKQLSYAADLFALGVVTFRLLSSYDPFYPASCVESELLFDDSCWTPLTASAKALVTDLLAPAPERRGSAAELLRCHPWLAGECSLAGQEARSTRAPQPLQGIGFHDLEASARIWQQIRRR